MSVAVIGWQLFIFFTIFISGRNRGWVAAFWALWTLIQVYALPLSIIQFLTIFYGYKLAAPTEDLNVKAPAPEHPQRARPETHMAPAPQKKAEKTPAPEKVDQRRGSFGDFMKYIQTTESPNPLQNNDHKTDTPTESILPSLDTNISALEDDSVRHMDSAYVTRHNFSRISSFYLQPDGDISIDKIFSVIYEKNLSEFLNQKEATRIYLQKQIIDKNFQSVRVVKKEFTRDYTFSVTPPKFHKDKDCVFLKADFSNYLVPPAIKALGEEKVREFQEFCESHKKEFEGKPDDVFWARVGVKFNIHINPERVDYYNSGIENIEKISIDDLREKINETISTLLWFLESGPKKNTIIAFRYAPSIKFALSKIQDEESKNEIMEFFKLKANLANFLFELYKKQSGRNSYILPITLLNACGIQACKGCFR